MARRRYAFDEGKIARFQKEGRGRGTSYKPWLSIQDVASHSRSHRIAGIKTGRVHHFLSDVNQRYPLATCQHQDFAVLCRENWLPNSLKESKNFQNIDLVLGEQS